MRIVVFILILSLTRVSQAAPANLHEGDLIFQQSQSRQAAAILEATGSPWSHVGILFKDGSKWVVAEAADRVRKTPLKEFVRRGKDGAYRIYRARDFRPTQLEALRSAVHSYEGKRYDLYFEWSEDLIYCSELTYKVFMKATGIEIGSIQKFSDLKLDGPFVQLMVLFRLSKTGRKLNRDESIVTPISQMEDNDLELVASDESAPVR